MMHTELEVRSRDAGGVVVFDLRGDLTEQAEKDFETVIKPRLGQGRAILMNFSQVSYINSSGIALLISFITTLQTAGGRLRICGLTPHFQKIFEIVGLTQYLEHFQDEAAALDGFSA